MRTATFLVLAATIAGCAPPPSPDQMAAQRAQAQQKLARLLTGKVAGQAQTCLSHFRSDDMVIVDDSTLAFRDGSRTWINHPLSPCSGLGSGHAALVTHNIGGTGLCRGDIGQVVDTAGNFPIGSCAMGDFVPYAPAAR